MSSKLHLIPAVALLALAYSSSATAFDAEGYHASNCSRCHDSSVYTRENRKMQSYGMLTSRVKGCDARFGEKLAEQNLSGLVDYLNDSYYKFGK